MKLYNAHIVIPQYGEKSELSFNIHKILMIFISLPRKIRTEIGDLLEEAQWWGEERIMTMLSCPKVPKEGVGFVTNGKISNGLWLMHPLL